MHIVTPPFHTSSTISRNPSSVRDREMGSQGGHRGAAWFSCEWGVPTATLLSPERYRKCLPTCTPTQPHTHTHTLILPHSFQAGRWYPVLPFLNAAAATFLCLLCFFPPLIHCCCLGSSSGGSVSTSSPSPLSFQDGYLRMSSFPPISWHIPLLILRCLCELGVRVWKRSLCWFFLKILFLVSVTQIGSPKRGNVDLG
ncbi:hypothetical protein HJG60_011949 [Phyllostomus discolor]|uniref:Uncharacterized protein n=1 Tax=Phyllostomus discolor TaxID=89673 RepID=A0A834DWI5_9CHIR|nr:hypothetical protein HJG60_011949 [Phyllostomus discolor]